MIPAFKGLPGAEDMILVENAELFQVKSIGAQENVVSELYAHPMGGGKRRGFNAYLVVNDEGRCPCPLSPASRPA